jgi:hypothetical protein
MILGNEIEYDDDEDYGENDNPYNNQDLDDSLTITEEKREKSPDSETETEEADDTAAASTSSIDPNNNDTTLKSKNDPKKEDEESPKLSLASVNNNNNSINSSQKMPLPYKVAKSIDPVIYRNTAFDAWLATKKEHKEPVNQKRPSPYCSRATFAGSSSPQTTRKSGI